MIIIDNKLAMRLIKNIEFYSWIKHIRIQYYFLKELVEEGNITSEYVSIYNNITNVLIKSLAWEVHNYYLASGGIKRG